jgi:hypothetical protein
LYLARFIGSGKRLRRVRKGKNHDIYGQRFVKRHKRYRLTDQFVEEAGLGNPDTDPAIILSLKTDYGLLIEREEPYKEVVIEEEVNDG